MIKAPFGIHRFYVKLREIPPKIIPTYFCFQVRVKIFIYVNLKKKIRVSPISLSSSLQKRVLFP